ncbi:MAG TPA: type II toxin-antitoxin system PemK/MazF family toxin [Tepidisphaeraceae bacterium]|nr:type II toxin-antitoxin system PemK/MazF family toxin [Tepidisphaeraceae bacterium]
MIRRGEVWLGSFDPTIGDEIRKKRPAVVLSSDSVGKLSIKLMAPMTAWKDKLAKWPWHVRITPDSKNGLKKVSSVDVLQVRGMDVRRFDSKLGVLAPAKIDSITAALAGVVEAPVGP